MDRLESMEAFTRSIELGSFSAAAKSLNTTPQNIAKLVTGLEKRVGARLINRNTRSHSSTEVGKLFYSRCKEILEEVYKAESLVQNYQQQIRGVLKLIVPSTFGIYGLSEKLPLWLKANPQVSIHVTVSDDRRNIIKGGFDLAIVVNEVQESRLICQKFCNMEVILAASPQYLEKMSVPATPEDLKNHSCLHLPEQQIWNMFSRTGESYTIDAGKRYISDNCQVLAKMAEAGLGITKQPLFRLMPLLESGKLIRVLPDFHFKALPLYVLYPHRVGVAMKVKSFISFLKLQFPESSFLSPQAQAGLENFS